MGELLPDFLVLQGAFAASKCLLDAKDHLRATLSMEAPRPTTSVPPAIFGEQPLPPLTDTPIPETKLLHNFLTLRTDFAAILSFACHYFAGELKKLLPWLSFLQKHAICVHVLNTFWPIRLINDDVRCNKPALGVWLLYISLHITVHKSTCSSGVNVNSIYKS